MKRSRLEAAMVNRRWCGLGNISVHLGVVSSLHPQSFVPRPAEIPPPCSLAKGHELRVTYNHRKHRARGLMLSSIVFYCLLVARWAFMELCEKKLYSRGSLLKHVLRLHAFLALTAGFYTSPQASDQNKSEAY